MIAQMALGAAASTTASLGDNATARLPGGLVAALRPLDPMAPWIGAWRRLGPRAVVANPFYEADYALAARDAFGAGVRMMLVADRPPEEAGARLLAAWPHRLVHRWGLPLPVLMGWTHGYAPLGAPLLDAGDPAAALSALLAAPPALGLPPRMLMPNAPADGPLPALLDGTGARRAAYWEHGRGLLDPAARPPDGRGTYLDHLSGNRKRRLRRARRRLEANGPVTFEILADPPSVAAALDAHIALEAAGWKGRAGTALAQHPAEAALLRQSMSALAAEDRLRIARLRRGDQLLASAILPLAGRDAFVLKVAHDDTDAAAAPGVQLVHRLTEAVLEGTDIARIDSCAPPGFALGSLFWTERRAIAHLLTEAGRDPAFPLAVRLERAREHVARFRLGLKARLARGRAAPEADA